jgi:ubiquinone/menaquinone biosynthesis C-methylase UbiE
MVGKSPDQEDFIMTDKMSAVRASDYGLPQYFDLQASMGHTKHLGGEQATRRLVELCHLEPGETLLNVGSGSGISAAYVAKNYDCNVVGVDLLPGMIHSAENWAREQGLAHRLEFRFGDAQELPFESNKFDVVICESVNTFVPDKAKAIREYFRVVKPGGYVGMSEAIWVNNPSDSMEKIIVNVTGQQFQPTEVWESLLESSGLVDIIAEKYPLSIKSEARSQAGLLNARSYLRILGRAIRLLITDRENRALLKYAGSNPRQYFQYMGYGLYVGRKPEG